MNAKRTRRPIWFLSVLLAVTPALMQPGQAQSGAAQPQVAATQKPETSSKKSVTGSPANLNNLFLKTRVAALRIEDCAPVAQDPACADPDGIGSAVLISADGHALTAYHVVENQQRIVAVTLDKKRYPVTVIGYDEPHDLALIKINISGAAFVPLAPQNPKVGQSALAIGNAGGGFLQPKSGKLLALDAAAGQADFPAGTLKLDAPLAPGDSGGPVLNEAGQLIGITSYIRIDNAGASGVTGIPFKQQSGPQLTSYAVPVTADSALLTKLRAGFKRAAPVVGLRADPRLTEGLDIDFFRKLGLGDKMGFIFTQVIPGSPAELAGLRPIAFTQNSPPKATGDVITAINGKAVTNFPEFLAAIRSYEVGDQVTLTVIRDGGATPLSIPVKLAPHSILPPR